MDKGIREKLKPEIGKLIGIISDAEHDEGARRYQLPLIPVGENFSAYLSEISELLVEAFPNRELFATLDVEVVSGHISVTVFLLDKYNIRESDGGWLVESAAQDGWYFETSNEDCARNLAVKCNTAPIARMLRRLSPRGVDIASLKMLLLGVRDNDQIDVTTFAHRRMGDFDRGNLLR